MSFPRRRDRAAYDNQCGQPQFGCHHSARRVNSDLGGRVAPVPRGSCTQHSLDALLVTHGLQKFSENIESIILSNNHLELKNMPCSVVAEVFCVWFATVITIKGKTMDTTTRGWTQSVVFVFIHVSIHWHCQHWSTHSRAIKVGARRD